MSNPLINYISNNNIKNINPSTVKKYLNKGIDINERYDDDDNRTALFYASALTGKKGTKIVDMLLKHGADINLQDRCSLTALHQSCFFGNVTTAKLLIDNHADIDAPDSIGWTPLMWAVKEGYIKIVKLLIEHGANISIEDDNGEMAIDSAFAKLEYAETTRNKQIFKEIIEILELAEKTAKLNKNIHLLENQGTVFSI